MALSGHSFACTSKLQIKWMIRIHSGNVPMLDLKPIDPFLVGLSTVELAITGLMMRWRACRHQPLGSWNWGLWPIGSWLNAQICCASAAVRPGRRRGLASGITAILLQQILGEDQHRHAHQRQSGSTLGIPSELKGAGCLKMLWPAQSHAAEDMRSRP